MKPYIKSKDYVAASLLMVLNHFDKLELTSDNESRIVNVCSKYDDAVLGSVLFAKENGLSPSVILPPNDKLDQFNASVLGLDARFMNFGLDDVERFVTDGRVVILHLDNDKSIVVYDFDSRFLIMDPDYGEMALNKDTLSEKYGIPQRMILF